MDFTFKMIRFLGLVALMLPGIVFSDLFSRTQNIVRVGSSFYSNETIQNFEGVPTYLTFDTKGNILMLKLEREGLWGDNEATLSRTTLGGCLNSFKLSYTYDYVAVIRQMMHSAGFTIICLLGWGSAFDLPRTNCSKAVPIDGDLFSHTETLHLQDAYPSDAHYDLLGNLFYVHTGRNLDGYFFDVYIIKSKTKSPMKISGIPEGKGYSIAVDKRESQVYFGTEEGIFRYDYETHSATPYEEISEKINMIFVDGHSNKYITQPNDGVDELYVIENGTKVPMSKIKALSDMGIDDKNDMYFIRENQLFLLKETDSAPKSIIDLDYSGTGQISFNGKGTVFIATEKLHYFNPNHTENMKEVSAVPGRMTALAFNNDGDFMLGLDGKFMKYQKVDCYFRN